MAIWGHRDSEPQADGADESPATAHDMPDPAAEHQAGTHQGGEHQGKRRLPSGGRRVRPRERPGGKPPMHRRWRPTGSRPATPRPRR